MPYKKIYIDGQGNEVPAQYVKSLDKKRDRIVEGLVKDALALQERIRAFKEKALTNIYGFVDYSARESGVKPGGEKGNVTLSNFSHTQKIEINIHEYVEMNEKLVHAKRLIDECFKEWTADSGQEIKTVIDQVFKVDKKGKVSVTALLGLRQLNIKNQKWKDAQRLITEGINVVSSKSYLRLQQRKNKGSNWKSILLDLAAIDVDIESNG